jgi:hypothetical protein
MILESISHFAMQAAMFVVHLFDVIQCSRFVFVFKIFIVATCYFCELSAILG